MGKVHFSTVGHLQGYELVISMPNVIKLTGIAEYLIRRPLANQARRSTHRGNNSKVYAVPRMIDS